MSESDGEQNSAVPTSYLQTVSLPSGYASVWPEGLSPEGVQTLQLQLSVSVVDAARN